MMVLLPKLLARELVQPMRVLTLFPALVVGVALAGVLFTGILEGRSGLRDLFSRIGRWRIEVRWYAAALLIPPFLISVILLSLSFLLAPGFSPNFFPLGILFGLFPGFFEEIGWMGYAFPKMKANHSALRTSIILGVLWALWHLPVVNYLGAAAPHGRWWPLFFVAFGATLTAMRVLVAWVYCNTQSLFLAQLMHSSFTGSLVVLSPSHLSAAQETFWYALYAIVAWIAVVLVALMCGKDLVRQSGSTGLAESLISRGR